MHADAISRPFADIEYTTIWVGVRIDIESASAHNATHIIYAIAFKPQISLLLYSHPMQRNRIYSAVKTYWNWTEIVQGGLPWPTA
jgi:hypothetical protein